MPKQGVYRCIRAYDEEAIPSGIVLHIGDEVQVDWDQADGDIGTGVNLRTRETGSFPWDCVVGLRPAKGPRPPSRPAPIQDVVVTRSPPSVPSVPHRFMPVSVSLPRLCGLCGDFVVTPLLRARQCSVCRQTYHERCWLTILNSPAATCHRQRQSAILASGGDDFVRSMEHPLEQWEVVQILQWLAVVGLSRFVEMFKGPSMTGSKLAAMVDDAHIPEHIQDPFHRVALRQAVHVIRGLHLGPGDLELDRQASPSVSGRGASVSEEDLVGDTCVNPLYSSSTGTHHSTQLTSFFSEQRCHYCLRPLLGVQKQGFLCRICGNVFHRICIAQDDLPECTPTSGMSPSVSTVFGVPLEKQVPAESDCVPPFLELCTEALERLGLGTDLNLFEAYRQSALTNELVDLVGQFGHGVTSIRQLDELGVTRIAQLIKWYLRELPDPVVPAAFYQRFAQAARLENEASREERVISLVGELPAIHFATLAMLMRHFRRLLKHQQELKRRLAPSLLATSSSPGGGNTAKLRALRRLDRLTSWSQVFCHILVRPPWPLTPLVVGSAESHIRLLEILLVHAERWLPRHMSVGDEASSYCSLRAPQTPNIGDVGASTAFDLDPSQLALPLANSSSAAVDQALSREDWYWADVIKEEVNEMMSGLPDGSFMVRDASSKVVGGYTLTLRKGGENKLIRIYHRNGLFGFIDPPDRFTSVIDLINYYRDHSLVDYNHQLDLTLSNPVSKHHQLFGDNQESPTELSNDDLVVRLKETVTLLRKTSKEINEVSEKYQEAQHDLKEATQVLRVFTKLSEWFKNQHKILVGHAENAEKQEVRDRLQSHLMSLEQRIESAEVQLEEQRARQDGFANVVRNLLDTLNLARPEVKKFNKKQQQITRLLRDRGVPDHVFHSTMDREKAEREGDSEVEPEGVDDVYVRLKVTLSESFPLHHRKNWFVDCSRNEAVFLLADKPNGTFLIRPSSEPNKFALDIRVDGTTQRCRIHRDPTTGKYGFIETKCIYATFEELVCFYHFNSLEQHNEQLKTRLIYPVHTSNDEVDQYLTFKPEQP